MIKKSNKQYSQITVDQLKRQLNIDLSYTDEDSFLETLIQASVDYCEDMLGADIVITDNEVTFKDFSSNSISIPESNLSGVTSITLNSEEITEYEVTEHLIKFTIDFEQVLSGDLTVNFKTGSNNIKPKHLQAILIKASDLYDAERQSYNYGLNHNDKVLHYLLTL